MVAAYGAAGNGVCWRMMEKPRVLHVITGLSTGGAERALYNVLAGGLAARYESAVVSLRDTGTFGVLIQSLGVPVHALHMRRGAPTPGVIGRLWRLVRELRPDVIQGWMYHGNLVASVTARMMPGRPAVVWNIRQSLYSLVAEKPMTRQVIRADRLISGGADAIIYNSHLSRTQHESFGFRGSQSTVIPNGFDLERLQPDPGTGALVRKELGLPADAVVIGHVARFHPMKDHPSFLRAAVRVVRENPLARFLLVGREVFPSHPALAGIVPPELMAQFVFIGERSDVHRLMHAIDVFCLSSLSEAFPNVLGEAMASGVPCVTTDVGDCADIVGDTGIVVAASDSEALAEALQTMIRKSSQERQLLGQAARERVKRHYGLGFVVGRYTDIYQQLLTRERNAY